jgi:hypothetical protein
MTFQNNMIKYNLQILILVLLQNIVVLCIYFKHISLNIYIHITLHMYVYILY